MTGIIEKLNQENMNLTQRLGDAENLIKPYLATKLGWYLHNGSDSVNKSRYTFTINGYVTNVGIITALNCSLVIHFYCNSTLVQTSNISMGDIYDDYYYLLSKNIQCNIADSVTRIEITPKWS